MAATSFGRHALQNKSPRSPIDAGLYQATFTSMNSTKNMQPKFQNNSSFRSRSPLLQDSAMKIISPLIQSQEFNFNKNNKLIKKAKEELKSAVRRQGQLDKKQHKIESVRYSASKVPTCLRRTRGASPKTSYRVVPLTNMSPHISPTSRDIGPSSYMNN
jgi:hypothetical protein